MRRAVPATEAWDVVPDVAIEVIGNSELAEAVVWKVGAYFQAGVGQVWVIFPSMMKIYVYDSATQVGMLQPGDELDGKKVIPGFRIPLSMIFESEEAKDTKASDSAMTSNISSPDANVFHSECGVLRS